MSFYAATAIAQATALLGVGYLAVPHAGFGPASQRLVLRLLWLQALVAPGVGGPMLRPRGGRLWRAPGRTPVRVRGAGRADYKALNQFSLYVALLQTGTLLADQVGAAVLGFVLPQPGPHIAVYDVVSKPYLLLRQTGTVLTSMVTGDASRRRASGRA